MIKVVIFISVITNIILLLYVGNVKKKLKDFYRILREIETEKSKQKLLPKSRGLISDIGYTLNDILYKYEEEIENLNTTLESNKQLMTSLSHDIRTPMTTLIGYLDAINLRLVDEKRQNDYLIQANAKAHDLKQYIDALFKWARLNSGEEYFHIDKVDIIETTRDNLKGWIPIWEEKELCYEINIPETVINIEIDVDSYNRIINNLIRNILAHSRANRITISAIEKRGKIILEVGDDGIGMEKEDLKYIFDRLYKCNKGRSGRGNGLGLNIVKMLTEKMNGTIMVKSEVNEGTIFTITFPVAND